MTTGQTQKDNYDKFAQEYLRRAGGLYGDAYRRFNQERYPEVVSAVQEALELTVKGIFRAAGVDPPTHHQIDDRRFREELRNVRKAVRSWNPKEDEWQTMGIGRVFFLAGLWAQVYTQAKYGSEALDLSPSELIGRCEAALALSHFGEVVTRITGSLVKSKGVAELPFPKVQLNCVVVDGEGIASPGAPP